MRKQILTSLFLIITVLSMSFVIANAENIAIKDIKDQYSKYQGEDLVISGEIKSLLYSETKNSFKKSIEINIYLIGDDTSDIYVLTTKHNEDNDNTTFTANILTKSRESIKDKQVMLYDKYILMKLGYTLPTLSKDNLKELIKKMPKGEKWILLIDIE